MENVYPNLYVGDDNDATKALESGRFYVVSCCKDGPNGHRSILKYKTLGAPKGKNYYTAYEDGHMAINLIDAEDPAYIPDEAVYAALKAINDHLQQGQKVLVHCNKGHSRSPSIVMLYLRSIGELPERFHEGFKIFKTLYPPYDPGLGMQHYVRRKYAVLKDQSELEKIYA